MAAPSFTKTYRQKSYPAIDPSRPELSAKDKTVIVTGAGYGGIGAAAALAFTRAGARKIALVGRTEKTLQATKDAIEKEFPDATVLISPADASRAESIGAAAHHLRATLGAWDVFVNCAGYLPSLTTLTGADEDDWWQAFETNVKFVHLFAKHFLSKRRPNATYIGTNAGACIFPAAHVPKLSAYTASKLAMAKLEEYLAEENPDLRVFTVHPGVVVTDMFRKATSSMKTGSGSGDNQLPVGNMLDEPELPANFMLWLACPEADFLKSGRYLWANWDVEELKARREEIEADPSLFRITIGGWPFA